jgi:hypothetical protein
MIGFLMGFLGVILPLAVFVALVVIVVRTATGQGDSRLESGGVHVRRFFTYSIMLATLVLVGVGLAGLIEAALPTQGVLPPPSTGSALSIAFVVVAGPLYFGLWRFTLRQLAQNPREQQSAGWFFYLTVALIGSLIVTMSLVATWVGNLISGDDTDRLLIIHLFIWAAVWAAHWVAASRYPSDSGTQIHLLVGSAVGLSWGFAGVAYLATGVLAEVYDSVFLSVIATSGSDELFEAALVIAIAAPVWWWYWLRHARGARRSRTWVAYTLLLGVLTGVVASISGAGVLLYSVAEWFIGEVTESAAAHFRVVPGALGVLLTGAGVWGYHAGCLADREARSRTEIDRVYGYLVAGAGLVVAASGVATLIASALTTIGGRGDAAIESGDTLAIAITLLVVGAPLWWVYWSRIQRYRRAEASSELASVTRRIYLVLLFGVAAIVAVINLIVLVFIVVEDLLEGTVGTESVEASAVAISLLATAAVVAIYHLVVFREDRRDMEPNPPLEDEVPQEPRRAVIPEGALESTLRELEVGDHSPVSVTVVDGGYVIDLEP